MKNLFRYAAIILMVALSQAVVAQDAAEMKTKTPEERAQMQTKWMKDKLALDDSQVSQVSAINLKYAKINEPVLKGDDGKLSKFKKLKATQKDKDNELKRVFTPEQFAKYLSTEDELKKKMKNRKSN